MSVCFTLRKGPPRLGALWNATSSENQTGASYGHHLDVETAEHDKNDHLEGEHYFQKSSTTDDIKHEKPSHTDSHLSGRPVYHRQPLQRVYATVKKQPQTSVLKNTLFGKRKRSSYSVTAGAVKTGKPTGRKDYLSEDVSVKRYLEYRSRIDRSPRTNKFSAVTVPHNSTPTPKTHIEHFQKHLINLKTNGVKCVQKLISADSVVVLGAIWKGFDSNVRSDDTHLHPLAIARDWASVVISVFPSDTQPPASHHYGFVISAKDDFDGYGCVVSILLECQAKKAPFVTYDLKKVLNPVVRHMFCPGDRCALFSLATFIFDVKIAAWTLWPGQSKSFYALDAIVSNLDVRKQYPPADPYEKLLIDHATLAQDVFPRLSGTFGGNRMLFHAFANLEMPTVIGLMKMEHCGFVVDVHALARMERRLLTLLGKLRRTIFVAVGFEFNIASPKEVSTVLVKHFRVKHGPESTTGGIRTDKVSLLALRRRTLGDNTSEFIDLVIQYRSVINVLGSHVRPLLSRFKGGSKDPNAKHYKIVPEWNQCNTITGRVTCSSPNLQNVPKKVLPVDTGVEVNVRRAFVASDTKTSILIKFDYSQMEMRVLAHFVGAGALWDLFQQKSGDIYKLGASTLYNKPLDQVTVSDRDLLKRGTLAIVYGSGGKQLARDLGIPIKDAEAFIKAFFLRFTHVKGFIDHTLHYARERGYISTITGRCIYFPKLKSELRQDLCRAQRQSLNAMIQGSAADVMKLGMLECQRWIEEYCCSSAGVAIRPILRATVHDELVFEINREKVAFATCTKAIKRILENAGVLLGIEGVDLPVNIKVGEAWGDMRDLPFDSITD